MFEHLWKKEDTDFHGNTIWFCMHCGCLTSKGSFEVANTLKCN